MITAAGNLVASKGFKTGVLDPTEVEELKLPYLQEEATEEPPLPPPPDDPFSASAEVPSPARRLRMKSRVSFVGLDSTGDPDPESLAQVPEVA